MLYALILTTYMTGKHNDVPTVAQSTTYGFTTEQACINAGKAAVSKAPSMLGRYENFAVITYQCAPLSI